MDSPLIGSASQVRMISSEAPALFARACEMFILEARRRRQRRALHFLLPSAPGLTGGGVSPRTALHASCTWAGLESLIKSVIP